MKFIVIVEKYDILHMCCSLEAREKEREREAKCLKLRTVKTISTLIRILEIISFASYYKTFLMCSQNPLLLYYSSTHNIPPLNLKLNSATTPKWYIFLGQTKLFHRFAL